MHDFFYLIKKINKFKFQTRLLGLSFIFCQKLFFQAEITLSAPVEEESKLLLIMFIIKNQSNTKYKNNIRSQLFFLADFMILMIETMLLDGNFNSQITIGQI